MATREENLAKFQEIARRGIQDRLPPEIRARFDEAMRRGLIQAPDQPQQAQAQPAAQPPQQLQNPFMGRSTDELIALSEQPGITPEQRNQIMDAASANELAPQQRDTSPEAVREFQQRKGEEFSGAAVGGLKQGFRRFGAGVEQFGRQLAEVSPVVRGAEAVAGKQLFRRAEEVAPERTAELQAREAELRQQYPDQQGVITGSMLFGEMAPLAAVPAGQMRTLGEIVKQGAKLGGLAGAVEYSEDGTWKDRAKKIALGTVAGAAGAGTVGAVGAGIERRAINKAMKEAVPNIDTMRTRADEMYGALETAGIKIPAREMQNTFNRIESVLETQTKYKPSRYPTIKKVLDEFYESSGKDASFWDFDGLRRYVRGHSKVSTTGGVPHPDETRMIGIIVDEMDEMFARLPNQVKGENASELVGKARQMWGRMRTAEAVEEALYKASLSPRDFADAVQQEFRTILRSKNKRRAYKREELEAMERIVNGSGSAENLARNVGKLLGTDVKSVASMFKTGLMAAAGTAAVGPAAAVLPGIGQVSKGLASRMTKGQSKMLKEIVAGGKDARKIAAAYMRNTPKAQRNPAELSELFEQLSVDPKMLELSKNSLFADAAFLTGKGAALYGAEQ